MEELIKESNKRQIEEENQDSIKLANKSSTKSRYNKSVYLGLVQKKTKFLIF